MSCIPTCSCWAALAVNGPSASAEAAAKAWRRVTRLFIIHLLAISSASASRALARFAPRVGSTPHKERARHSLDVVRSLGLSQCTRFVAQPDTTLFEAAAALHQRGGPQREIGNLEFLEQLPLQTTESFGHDATRRGCAVLGIPARGRIAAQSVGPFRGTQRSGTDAVHRNRASS